MFSTAVKLMALIRNRRDPEEGRPGRLVIAEPAKGGVRAPDAAARAAVKSTVGREMTGMRIGRAAAP